MNKVWVIPLIGLLGGLVVISGCGTGGVGGADLKLEGLTVGSVTMEGKPVEGIPLEEVSLLLDVSARTIVVTSTEDGIILTAEPSGSTVEITDEGISIKGLKSESIKVEWQSEED